MRKLLFIILVVANVFLVVSSEEEYEEKTVKSESRAFASAQASSSSHTKTDGNTTISSSSSSACAQANASSSVVTETKRRCKKNERWVDCPPILCVPETCDQLGTSISCPRIDPKNCPKKPACVCIEGYVRNKDGICIDKKQCPSCRGDRNAESGCGFLCGSRCDRKVPPKSCPCEINGCQCKDGFTYDPNLRKCVCPSECTKPCLTNEVYDTCPLPCPPRKCGIDDRAILCRANQTCLPAGCRCKDGTYRTNDGNCVPWDQCPKPCPKNEVWTSCANGGCGKWNCTQIDEPILCIDPIKCNGGCICKKDFLRSKEGQCIPQEDCRKNLCPKSNEVYDSCPLACPPRKCGIDDRAVLCQADQPCMPRGCRCKDGTYRHDNGECVLWEDCPKPCPKNEVWTSCANGGCGKWNCTQIDEPILCIDSIKCNGGCICKKDFLRSKEGQCIPQKDCRKNLCPKSNEVYDSCPLACPPRKCGIDDSAVLCQADQPCMPRGCRCKDETYRNDNGECVLWEDCPPIKPDECGNPEEEKCPADISNLQQQFVLANANLTSQFLYDSMEREPNENLIMSAFSLFTPFGMLAGISQGNTLKQFLSVFNLASINQINCVMKPLLEKLSSVQEVILNLAVRLFATDKFPLSKSFLDFTRDVYKAIAESLNFNDPKASADRINEWAANATNNLIKSIVTPDMFTPDTRLVLANAMYFRGNWTNQFNPNNTEDRDFYVTKDKPVKIPTMYQQNTFKYGYSDKLKCKVLEMPYKGGNVSFVVYLPDEIDGLKKLIQQLLDPVVFYEAYHNTTYEKVQVYLPKIKIESKFDLSNIMKKVGLTDVFDPTTSNLYGIFKTNEPLYVSACTQKAFIEVDETGTKAAVVNTVVVGTTSVMYPPPKIYQFKCDRPFVYFIFDINGQPSPLFGGAFAKPSAT